EERLPDLKKENVLIRLDSNDDTRNNTIQSLLDIPELPPNGPLCKSITTDVRLADFGSAVWIDRCVYPHANALDKLAPELILGYPSITPAVDIWALGCLAFELLTGHILFIYPPEELSNQYKGEKLAPKWILSQQLLYSGTDRIPPYLVEGAGQKDIVRSGAPGKMPIVVSNQLHLRFDVILRNYLPDLPQKHMKLWVWFLERSADGSTQ
ncbi:hypothetical protein BT69DRAFT_1334113, partial [Atractiella rhizophila]